MTKQKADQIAFRYRAVDSQHGVTRATVLRLTEALGVDETQTIHLALKAYARAHLPQYEADDAALSAAQLRQIRKRVPQDVARTVRSSLFAVETT